MSNSLILNLLPISCLIWEPNQQASLYAICASRKFSRSRNVRMNGEYYTFEGIKDLQIPARMQYRFRGS